MEENALIHGGDTDSLMHYGVVGMKWGVRRYQNKDGTLTDKGKKRYKKSPEQIESEKEKRLDVKNRGAMTTDELKRKMERELRTLTDEEINPGKRFVMGIVKDVGEKTLKTALTGAALYGVKAATAKEFDMKDFGEAMFNGGAKKK